MLRYNDFWGYFFSEHYLMLMSLNHRVKLTARPPTLHSVYSEFRSHPGGEPYWLRFTVVFPVPPVKFWDSKWKQFMSILSISSLPQNIWHCWVAAERLQWSDWMHSTSLTFVITLSSLRGSRLCVQLVTEVQLAKIHHYHNSILITECSTHIIRGPQISSTKSHDFRSFWKQKTNELFTDFTH
jgi:hypothetical protein